MLLRSNFSSFPQHFLPVVRFSCLGSDQIFTSRLAVIRDKRSRDNGSQLYRGLQEPSTPYILIGIYFVLFDMCLVAGFSRPKCHGLFGLYSRLSLSRTPRDSMKHFETSVLRHIGFAELRKLINRTNTLNRMNM